jgi:hypothetical protein
MNIVNRILKANRARDQERLAWAGGVVEFLIATRDILIARVAAIAVQVASDWATYARACDTGRFQTTGCKG